MGLIHPQSCIATQCVVPGMHEPEQLYCGDLILHTMAATVQDVIGGLQKKELLLPNCVRVKKKATKKSPSSPAPITILIAHSHIFFLHDQFTVTITIL